MTKIPCCEESQFITTLWEIRAWSRREEDLTRNLTNLACLVGNQFLCDVCSIYQIDRRTEEIVLAATVGLRQDCVGRLRLKIGEGLCGQVAATLEPLMVEEDAMKHPQFRYCPEAGEEPYASFLGVPIGWREELQGVLVVQTTSPRAYTPLEIRMLTLAADLMIPALRHLPLPPVQPALAKAARR